MGAERRAQTQAGVMELVDVADSKSADGDIVGVRVPPPAPTCVAKKDAGEKHRMKMRCFSYFKKNTTKTEQKSCNLKLLEALF